MISRRTLFRSTAGAGLALFGPQPATSAAASYPSRPVRWIVPYAAGGATDVLSRLICQYLQDRLGQPFIVENKPGAGSNIGTQDVINSPPDGYTLLLTSTANAINASFDPALPYALDLKPFYVQAFLPDGSDRSLRIRPASTSPWPEASLGMGK